MGVQYLEGKQATVEDIRKILNESGPSAVYFADDDKEPIKMIAANGGLWTLLQAAGNLDRDRLSRYRDYDEMEDDAIVASALEMCVDDSSQYSREANATVWVAEDSEYKKEIEEFFHQIDLENKVWGWVYNIAKYGDFFLRVYRESGVGITGLEEDIHPSKVYRIDIQGNLEGFILRDETGSKEDLVYGPSEFVHFINNFKPNFERVVVRVTEDGEEVKKVITSTYGSSILQNARRIYKILNLLEISMALARLARAPLIRIFYVNTTGMDPDTRKRLIRDIEEEYKKKISIDVTKDWYEQKYSPMNNTSDLFLPITGEIGDMRLESIGGDVNVKDIADIDYIKNKLFAALRTPAPFMMYEESTSSLDSSKGLGRLDVRYARMAKKVQRSLLEGLYRAIQIHLSYKYKREQDVRGVHLAMVPISSAEEDSRMEFMERKIGLSQSMLDLMSNTEQGFDAEYLIKYVFTRILDLPQFDLDKLLTGGPPEQPPEEQASEYKQLADDLKSLVENKCQSIDIIKLVETFIRSQMKKRFRFVPKSKDLSTPTLSEANFGKRAKIITTSKRNNVKSSDTQ